MIDAVYWLLRGLTGLVGTGDFAGATLVPAIRAARGAELASVLSRDSERARHALNQKLYELRQVLGDDWLQGQTERMRVTPTLDVDAHAFESAARRGDLEQALSLYDGAFLADFYLRESIAFEHWVDRHRMGQTCKRRDHEFLSDLHPSHGRNCADLSAPGRRHLL